MITAGCAVRAIEGYVPFPEADAQRYRAAGFWTGTPLGDLLRISAQRHGVAPAILGDHTVSYDELDSAADQLAYGLLAMGIGPGDRVVLQLPNIAEFPRVLFGLLRAGVIPVLALPAHRQAEIVQLATVSGAVGYLIADRCGDFDYRALARDLQRQVPSVRHVLVIGDAAEFVTLPTCQTGELPVIDPSDIALMLVSGGTTGLPKLIPRTHDDYVYNITASAQVAGLTARDVYLTVLPAAHNFSLACPGILGTVAVGGAVVFARDPSPDHTFALIETHQVTVTAVVPPIAQIWCAATAWETADLASLRLLQVGGAKLAQATAREVIEALRCTLQQVFGMAEGLLNYTRLDDSVELICTTQGRPLSRADEIRIVDEQGQDVPPGTTGELLTRGPYTLRGYFRAPQHNARAFTPDGFYRSGDLVRQLPSGHVVVSGRSKDVINRGGENVSCEELEEHLSAHRVIRQVAAIGLPDAALGEKVCVVLVVCGQLPTLAELKVFLTDRGLASYKSPDVVRQLEILPVTAVGKVNKKALRAQFAHL